MPSPQPTNASIPRDSIDLNDPSCGSSGRERGVWPWQMELLQRVRLGHLLVNRWMRLGAVSSSMGGAFPRKASVNNSLENGEGQWSRSPPATTWLCFSSARKAPSGPADQRMSSPTGPDLRCLLSETMCLREGDEVLAA